MSAYSRLLERVLLPAYDRVRGRRYARHRAFLEESQWWPPAKLEEFQWAEVSKLVRVAFETVPYYKEKYAGIKAEDIRGFADYAELPPLTREEVNANRDRLRSTAYEGHVYAHATGGSSGTPTRFYVSRESFDWRTAATQRVYSWPGCLLGERTLYLWGAPVGEMAAWPSLKMKAFRAVRREFMFPTFAQSPEMWRGIYEHAIRIRAPFVVGYVSSLEQFCRYLLANGLKLPGVRAAIAAAEPVHAHHRALAADALGAPLFNTYGSREFMSIAGECPLHDGLHVNMENVLIETALPAEQGPSAILVTDLHNYGMPFLRYEIGDVGTLDTSPCACGRGLMRIRSIEGRVLDMLRTVDGRIVPGEFFPHVMKEIPEVKEFQAEQKALDHIVVSVVLSGEMSERSRAVLDGEVRKVFGQSMRLDFQRVDAIPTRASGKRRVTIGFTERGLPQDEAHSQTRPRSQ